MSSSRKRPRSEDITADRKALIGIKSLPDYAPRNDAQSVTSLTTLQQKMEAAVEMVVHTTQVLTIARDDEAAAIRAFHEGMLGAKAEVLTQYGADSGVVQLMGLKRKSDRNRPARRENGTEAAKAKAPQTQEK
jgi:hypothetical protein